DVVGDARIFRSERVDVANLYVGGNDARPFGAGAEEKGTGVDHAGGVEGSAGDEELELLAGAEVGTDDRLFARSVDVQHQNLDRVSQIVVVELVVSDAVELHRFGRRHHEIESRPYRTRGVERRGKG